MTEPLKNLLLYSALAHLDRRKGVEVRNISSSAMARLHPMETVRWYG